MICTKCHIQTVITERISLGLTTCLKCAENVPKYKGALIYGHKTAGDIQVMHPATFNAFKKVSARNAGKACNLGKTMYGGGVTEILI